MILNLSASNELVGKADYRRELVKVQSGRTLSAYVYANDGVHESTTDVVFGGQLLVAENAMLLAEGERFAREGDLLVTDVDVERLLVERMRQTSFDDAVHALARSPTARIAAGRRSRRRSRTGCCARWTRTPSCPPTPPRSTSAAARSSPSRPRAWPSGWSTPACARCTLGLSGGLDSTLALLVVDRTFDLLGLPREGILAVTMPGFGTTSRHARERPRLARAAGVALREIDIRAACAQHFRDIGLGDTETGRASPSRTSRPASARRS